MGDNPKYLLTALLSGGLSFTPALAQEEPHSIPSGIPDAFRDLVPEAVDSSDAENTTPKPVPQGVVFAEFHVDGVRSGDVIVMVEDGRLLFDDPAAVIDVPHYCLESGHTLVGSSETPTHQIYLIRRK